MTGYRRVLLKLSGEVFGGGKVGVDPDVVEKVAREIKAVADTGVQIAVEFRDPDGHHLEIYWGIDQFGSDGAARPPEQWKGASSLEAAIADPVIGQDTTLQDPTLLRG